LRLPDLGQHGNAGVDERGLEGGAKGRGGLRDRSDAVAACAGITSMKQFGDDGLVVEQVEGSLGRSRDTAGEWIDESGGRFCW